jgi:hypothetical protein
MLGRSQGRSWPAVFPWPARVATTKRHYYNLLICHISYYYKTYFITKNFGERAKLEMVFFQNRGNLYFYKNSKCNFYFNGISNNKYYSTINFWTRLVFPKLTKYTPGERLSMLSWLLPF